MDPPLSHRISQGVKKSPAWRLPRVHTGQLEHTEPTSKSPPACTMTFGDLTVLYSKLYICSINSKPLRARLLNSSPLNFYYPPHCPQQASLHPTGLLCVRVLQTPWYLQHPLHTHTHTPCPLPLPWPLRKGLISYLAHHRVSLSLLTHLYSAPTGSSQSLPLLCTNAPSPAPGYMT